MSAQAGGPGLETDRLKLDFAGYIMNTTNLWSTNQPRDFWLCEPDFPEEIWQEAVLQASPLLGIGQSASDIASILEYTIGEGRFGTDRYKFNLSRRLYYKLKPYLSQKFTHAMRRVLSGRAQQNSGLSWPIEARYVQFQREIIRQCMLLSGRSRIHFRYFWPENKKFAFILTHDVETSEGQQAIPRFADLEESLGFRSSFNFVPERYKLDHGLMRDLQKRGFEIGVHGLKHDGTLFGSQASFDKQVGTINQYLRDFQAQGFRSPYTHRNPDWMQQLEIEYDTSFFDTDPFEPMPGGVMTIWPFRIGHFLELPYTLPQDCTLFNVLHKGSNAIWQEKIVFIKKYNGMALMIIHPDYSGSGHTWEHFAGTLKEVYEAGEYWHALPRQVACWWKARLSKGDELHPFYLMTPITLDDGDLNIGIPLKLDGIPADHASS